MSSYIYAYFDLNFLYLSSPDMNNLTVYYKGIQMGPLPLILWFGTIFMISLKGSI